MRLQAACDAIGLSPRGVQAMAARGEIPGAAKIGRVWTFDADSGRGLQVNPLKNKTKIANVSLCEQRIERTKSGLRPAQTPAQRHRPDP